jgi:hypothetical protein
MASPCPFGDWRSVVDSSIRGRRRCRGRPAGIGNQRPRDGVGGRDRAGGRDGLPVAGSSSRLGRSRPRQPVKLWLDTITVHVTLVGALQALPHNCPLWTYPELGRESSAGCASIAAMQRQCQRHRYPAATKSRSFPLVGWRVTLRRVARPGNRAPPWPSMASLSNRAAIGDEQSGDEDRRGQTPAISITMRRPTSNTRTDDRLRRPPPISSE